MAFPERKHEMMNIRYLLKFSSPESFLKFYFMCVCMFVSVCAHACRWVHVGAREDVRSPSAGTAGPCEPSGLAARNNTWVL